MVGTWLAINSYGLFCLVCPNGHNFLHIRRERCSHAKNFYDHLTVIVVSDHEHLGG
jgi:hypothetical protein